MGSAKTILLCVFGETRRQGSFWHMCRLCAAPRHLGQRSSDLFIARMDPEELHRSPRELSQPVADTDFVVLSNSAVQLWKRRNHKTRLMRRCKRVKELHNRDVGVQRQEEKGCPGGLMQQRSQINLQLGPQARIGLPSATTGRLRLSCVLCCCRKSSQSMSCGRATWHRPIQQRFALGVTG